MEYYPGFICQNGHIVEILSRRCTSDYCTKCGSPVTNTCAYCGEVIHGQRIDYCPPYRVPAYCHSCGKPYPWTQAAIQATLELLAEDENLTAEECNRLVEVLPDALVETPRSQLAAARIGKALRNAGKFTVDALRQFVLDFACELVKKQLGLQ